MSGHEGGRKRAAALDAESILKKIGVRSGQTVLDVGCGEGRFSLPAARMVGWEGKVLAFDTSVERIEALKRTVEERSLDQIEAFVADVTETLPMPAHTVDICLVADVFHELVEESTVQAGLREMRRVLRPGGILAIVEFKKNVSRPPGPPLSIRLSPDELGGLLSQHGFEQKSTSEVGSFHYLSLFALRSVGA
jgi:ubiquinone/menaquinone biosynthesis C-methylase UbiE